MKCAKVPESLKYFCQSEAIAFYLQNTTKNVNLRWSKDFADLSPLIKKIQRRKILYPFRSIECRCTNHTKRIKVDWTPAVLQNSYE
jgi:hypothetical protein